eukprot:185535-Pyramimonas_sp.AAC.1
MLAQAIWLKVSGGRRGAEVRLSWDAPCRRGAGGRGRAGHVRPLPPPPPPRLPQPLVLLLS